MDPDPDDIIRVVNEDSQDECAAEILRLKRKRRGFRAAFTEIQNVVDRLVASSRGPDNRVDKSKDKRLAIERHSLQLEQRYQKPQKLNHRVLSLNFVEADEQAYQDCCYNHTIVSDSNSFTCPLTTLSAQRVPQYGIIQLTATM